MSAAKGIQSFGDGIVTSFFSNPRALIYTAIGIVILVIAIRLMRADKRKAKEAAKKEAEIIKIQEAREKEVYELLAKKYNNTVDWVKSYDDVAAKLSASISDKWYKNDDEEEIIRQMNRINGQNGLDVVNFFFKQYLKDSSANVAYDCMKTLTRQQFAKIDTKVQEWLVILARQKGDLGFFDWKYGL